MMRPWAGWTRGAAALQWKASAGCSYRLRGATQFRRPLSVYLWTNQMHHTCLRVAACLVQETQDGCIAKRYMAGELRVGDALDRKGN